METTQSEVDELVPVETFAAEVHKTPKALLDLRYRGQLPPATKIGRSIYWRRSVIEAWKVSQTEVPRDAA